MYFDLKFPFRISEKAGVAHDENGNNAEAYAKTSLVNCKRSITEDQYNKLHESQKLILSKILEVKEDFIICISPEDYENNNDDDDEFVLWDGYQF